MGDVLSQAVDGSPRVSVPTMGELQPVMDSDVYAEQRSKSYPPVSDQLDALWKFIESLPSASLPDDTAAVLNDIVKVKTDIPKPEATNVITNK